MADTNPPSGGDSKTRDVLQIAGFNAVKEPLAKAFVDRLPLWARRFIVVWQWYITGASALVARLTPSRGKWIITDYQLDFVQEVIAECRRRENLPADQQQAAAGEPAVDQSKQRRRIALAAIGIADPKARAQFDTWLKGLSKGDENKLLLLAHEADDAKLKDLLKQPTDVLDATLAVIPDAVISSKKISRRELMVLVAQVPALQKKIDDYLQRAGLKPKAFWNAVEKLLDNDLTQVELTMALPDDDQRAVYLGLDPHGRTPMQMGKEAWEKIEKVFNQLTTATPGRFDLLDLADPLVKLDAAIDARLQSTDPDLFGSKAHADRTLADAKARRQRALDRLK